MGQLTELWNIIKDALVTFGFERGLFLLAFLGGHYWIYRMYDGRLKDRQKEIDNLAQDNRQYRDLFLTLMDRHFGLPPRDQKPLPEEPKPGTPKQLDTKVESTNDTKKDDHKE